MDRVRKSRGTQMVEESLLLAVSLMALMIILSMISGFLTTVKQAYENSQNSLDKFLVEVFRDDLDTLWNSTIGQLYGNNQGG